MELKKQRSFPFFKGSNEKEAKESKPAEVPSKQSRNLCLWKKTTTDSPKYYDSVDNDRQLLGSQDVASSPVAVEPTELKSPLSDSSSPTQTNPPLTTAAQTSASKIFSFFYAEPISTMEIAEKKEKQFVKFAPVINNAGAIASSGATFFSWFKSTNREDSEMSNNPFLQLATATSNEQFVTSNSSFGSLHRSDITGGSQLVTRDTLDVDDDLSSVESFSTIGSEDAATDQIESTNVAKDEFGSLGVAIQTISVDARIQDTFELPELEVFKDEFACWLLKSVFLKGYVYLTSHHFCFYASIPSTSTAILHSGFLKQRTLSRPRHAYSTYWVVLKPDVLFTYQDSTEMYYPLKGIQLKLINAVQSIKESETDFKIVTSKKSYHFKADTLKSKLEWVELLTTSVYKAKIGSNDIRIVVPFQNISDIAVSKSNMNGHCLRISVYDNETMVTDEYTFAYFNNVFKAQELLSQLRNDVLVELGIDDIGKPNSELLDNVVLARPVSYTAGTNYHDRSHTEQNRRISPLTAFAASKYLTLPKSRPIPLTPKQSDLNMLRTKSHNSKIHNITYEEDIKRHTWWGQKTKSHLAQSKHNSALTLHEDSEMQKEIQFQKMFAFGTSENLLGSFGVYLIKVLPYIGTVYVSNNSISFRSKLVGNRAKVIVPISDISKITTEKGYFLNGLIITTNDHEEILFEFHTAESQNNCLKLLEDLISKGPNIEYLPAKLIDTVIHTDTHINIVDTESNHIPTELKRRHHKPMRITCITIGTRGDVQPFVALCLGLMKDGHTCTIATHLEFREWILGFGISFKEIKGNPAELMQLCVEHGMFTVGFIRNALTNFRGWVDELLVSCWEAGKDTDLIIESPTAMGGMHVAEKLGIPFIRAFTMPWTRTTKYPHPFGVPERPLGASYNYMSHIMIEQIFWKGTSTQVNDWRRKTLGLRPINLSSLGETHAPFLYCYSPNVVRLFLTQVPPPSDWPDWIHTCGYWFLDRSEHNWTPAPSLVKFISQGPVIYIGFGSIVVQDPQEMTSIILEAVKQANVRVILSKGWSGRMKEDNNEKEIIYPSNVYALDKVPHDWLFPQMAGVVHHGGSGTTAAGLRAGCPTLIRPFFGDQYFWADRIQDLGVGIALKKFTVKQFASSLVALSNPKIKERAQLLGAKIRSENGVEKAMQFIYRDLELAQERVRRRNVK